MKTGLKYGCFGCLGIIAFAAFAVAIVVGLGWAKSRSEEIEKSQLSRPVPVPAEAAGAELPAGPGGRVVLDLRGGEFFIERGRPGEPIRVDAEYDRNAYTLEESYDAGDGSRWTYTLTFRRTNSGLVAFVQTMFSGSSPRVRVYLPDDTPFALELELGQGGARVELGGLWLTTADVSMTQGGLDLSIEEPLREPMQRLSISTRQGGGQLSRLGNASPRRLELDMKMGGLEVDLRGSWAHDAEVLLSAHMGGGAVRLPKDVQLAGIDFEAFGLEREPLSLEPREGHPRPTLLFTISRRMAEIELLR